MTEFEGRVLADLCVLKSQMSTLLGDTQPGRIAEIEQRVAVHERALQHSKGLAMGIGGLFALVQLALDCMRRR